MFEFASFEDTMIDRIAAGGAAMKPRQSSAVGAFPTRIFYFEGIDQ